MPAGGQFSLWLSKTESSRPMMLTPLPVTLTGMCTGIWVLLPETMPGELVAEPSAEVSAMAAPAPARTTPLVAAVSTASFLRFIGFLLAAARLGHAAAVRFCHYSGHCDVPVWPGRFLTGSFSSSVPPGASRAAQRALSAGRHGCGVLILLSGEPTISQISAGWTSGERSTRRPGWWGGVRRLI